MVELRTTGWVALAVRLVLGGLFVFAGVMKLNDVQQFAFAVKAFKILPDSLIVFAAFAVPWTEIVAGLMLVYGWWARSAALLIGAMLLAFIAAIVSVIMRDLDVKCTCFGKFEFPCTGPVGVCHLVRNSVLAAMAGLVVLMGPGPLAAELEPAVKPSN